ncbi:MAG TPA: PQQ-binding-like beta-propeller repeat protein [Bryobacteraceae bacterium]|jgi:quinoprotein glucose dehydrogenase|nr:PQQ-binding-like beta-propeller repeat protein [Bryobacteraceae bacterium]
MKRRVLIAVTLAVIGGAGWLSFAAKRRDTSQNWSIVGGARGMHYSPLTQIDCKNVKQLERAWEFDSGDQFEGSEMECSPLVLDGVLYATTPRLRVVALDAITGKQLWDFDAHRGEHRTQKLRNRGLVYWGDGDDRRLFVGIDHYLYALSAKTGQPVTQFGDHGRLDLHEGLGDSAKDLTIEATSPGVVYRDLLIQGTLVAEDLPAAPGFIRAFDVHTGKLRWIFHTIPQPGEPGYETWPKDAYQRIGGVNSWAGLTLDAKRGLVFAPTGSASFDFYGANRLGDDLYANCLLALNADTGKLVWHFQLVRHDLWDRDLPSAPTLVRVKQHGKTVDAVAQITKYGYVWIFDELTGKPLVPYREIKTPPSPVDGEVTATTQVLPTEPAPYARQQVFPETLTDRTPQAHAAVLAQFAKLKSGPQFTPPSFEGTVMFPGFDGGGEWGGAAWDPKTGILYVNSNEMAWILRLIPRSLGTGEMSGSTLYRQNCAGCHRPDRQGSPPEFPSLINIGSKLSRDDVRAMVEHGGGRMPGFARLGKDSVNALVDYVVSGKDVRLDGAEHQKNIGFSPLKYGIDGYNRWLDPDGFPAVKPPWGTLNAINLNTEKYVWKKPFGEIPALAAQGVHDTGSENYGGSIVTAGGLLFIGATTHDHKFRAFDKATGELLWEAELPAGGNATPAVYAVKGREYVVIGAGGGKWGEKSGGSYVAFALPEKARVEQ